MAESKSATVPLGYAFFRVTPAVTAVFVDEFDAGSVRDSMDHRSHWRPPHSTLVYFQTDADFSGFIVSKVNAGLLKNFLYLEYRGEVSFHNSLILLDPLKCCQADPSRAGELILAPAQQRSRRPYLGGISHQLAVFLIRSQLTTPLI